MICRVFRRPLPSDICTAVATALQDAKLNMACSTQTGFGCMGLNPEWINTQCKVQNVQSAATKAGF